MSVQGKWLSSGWNSSPEKKVALRKANNSPESKARFSKMTEKWNNSPENIIHIKKIADAWNNSPEGKAFHEKLGNSPENIARLLNFPRARITYGKCGIPNHKHRSKLEIVHCKILQKEYGPELIHSCVQLGRIEADFVIGTNAEDPKTWTKVIEPHVIRFWNGESADYEAIRTEELRAANITCPIEIILQ